MALAPSLVDRNRSRTFGDSAIIKGVAGPIDDQDLRGDLRIKIRAALQNAVAERGSLARVAAELGISKQRLHTYSTGRATPSADVLLRMMECWGFEPAGDSTAFRSSQRPALTDASSEAAKVDKLKTAMNAVAIQATGKQRLKVFFSYSHKDARLREKLEKHLSVLKREGEIESWHDGDIGAGKPLDHQIAANLEIADMILLLVSAEFVSSDYCWSKEMLRAIERHERGEARVIPIILRPCDWLSAPFGKLRALPTDGKPVASSFWPNTDTAFLDIARGVRRAIQELRLQQA